MNFGKKEWNGGEKIKEKKELNLTFLENIDGKKTAIEQIKNILFANEICKNITDELGYEMSDYFEDDVIDKMIDYINKKELKERKRILAYPLELRNRIFSIWSEKIISGEKTEKDFINFLLEQSEKEKYNIGYHVSNHDIKKEYNSDGLKWIIKGYDPDYRDNDTPMAYYSKDYMHRYVDKGKQKFLYIVRSIEDDTKVGGHRLDGDNRWGRAPGLDIIHKVDMNEIENNVDSVLEEKFSKLDTRTLKRYINNVYKTIDKNNPSVEEKDFLELIENN